MCRYTVQRRRFLCLPYVHTYIPHFRILSRTGSDTYTVFVFKLLPIGPYLTPYVQLPSWFLCSLASFSLPSS